MKTNPQDWIEWDQSEVLPFKGGISFHTRTSVTLTVTDHMGLLIALGDGEQEIRVTGSGELKFDCDGPIWLKPSARVQERLQSSTEIFTTLDRPAPLSPEMLAIERMMRRNELQREQDRQEMEQRFADRLREQSGRKLEPPAPKASADKKEAVRDDPGPGGDDTPKQIKSSSGKNAKPDPIPDGQDADVDGSATDS